MKKILVIILILVSSAVIAAQLPIDHKIGKIYKIRVKKEYSYYYMKTGKDKTVSGIYSTARYYTDKLGRKKICGELAGRVLKKGGKILNKNKNIYTLNDYTIQFGCWDDSYIIEAVKKAPFKLSLKYSMNEKPFPVYKPWTGSKAKFIKHKDFDELELKYRSGGKNIKKTLKGERWDFVNFMPKNEDTNYYLINRNIIRASKLAGGEKISGTAIYRGLIYKFENGDNVYWVKTHAQDKKVQVTILKEKGFKKSIKMDVGNWDSEFVERGKITLDGVKFEFNKAKLKPESKKALDKAIAVLKKNEGIVVRVAGHTDNVGNKQYNRKLSQRRAEAVRKYLIEKGGISPKFLIANGYGDEKPVASNKTDEGRAKNRRVELVKVKDKRPIEMAGNFDAVFKPFPGSKLVVSKKKTEALEVKLYKSGKVQVLKLKGARKKAFYQIMKKNGKPRKNISPVEIKENYKQEVTRNGGEIIEESKYGLLYRFKNKSGSAWVYMHVTGYKYSADIVFTKK